MQTIRIGRSRKENVNDIVIDDESVSSEHAKITILDNGEIYIKDLNSTNGTYVNGVKIHQSTLITKKDIITVSKVNINWLQYVNDNIENKGRSGTVINNSNKENNKNINIKTIGRTDDNNIVFPYDNVSKHHATLTKETNGNIIITDNNSTNGTFVNGTRITAKILNHDDVVLIAGKYPLMWEQLFSKSNLNLKKWIKLVGGIAAAIIFIIGIGFLYNQFKRQKPQKSEILTAEQIYSKYKKSVVMIFGAYYYEVSCKGKTLAYVSVNNKGELVNYDGTNPICYTGTGFFVSKDGKIMTNRHVVCPWDYDGDMANKVKELYQEYIATLATQNQDAFVKLQPMIGDIVVQGRLESKYMGIFLNDTRVNSVMGDMIHCSYITDSQDKDIDVGMIQINSKTLPQGVTTIVDKIETNQDSLKIGAKIYTIGFPEGLELGQTDIGLEANNQSGEVTQLRGDISFGHNMQITHGASGSPIFNQYGQLVGIVNAGYEKNGVSTGYNMAISAKYISKLLNNK